MPASDPRIDRYIEQAAEFAQPILRELRARVHRACPAVEETIKWGMPHFMLDGRILANLAAFKQHCAFGFWRGAELEGLPGERSAMGDFGRITALADLPDEPAFIALVRRAAERSAAPAPRTPKSPPKPPAAMPAELATALAAQPVAQRHFAAFSPSQQREYIDWIADAKRADTRERRLAQAIEWLAEGKPRHWKYQRC